MTIERDDDGLHLRLDLRLCRDPVLLRRTLRHVVSSAACVGGLIWAFWAANATSVGGFLLCAAIAVTCLVYGLVKDDPENHQPAPAEDP